jgi:CheY-like chemotaxis protein
VASGTGSSPSADRARSLHRLRSTLARVKAELELAEADGTVPPLDRLLEDLNEAFVLLSEAEDGDVGRAPVRVVVMDDDRRLGDVTARGLRRLGYEAESTDGVRRAQAGEVLVVDLGLLEGLATNVISEMRGARPIIVTGSSGRAARALADSVAASAYLVKPVDLEQLVAAIERRVSQGLA